MEEALYGAPVMRLCGQQPDVRISDENTILNSPPKKMETYGAEMREAWADARDQRLMFIMDICPLPALR